MSKVTLILEDILDDDGKPGLTIDWQSANDYEEGSLAYQYATAFVQGVVSNANKAEIVDRDAPTTKAKGSEDDPSFN